MTALTVDDGCLNHVGDPCPACYICCHIAVDRLHSEIAALKTTGEELARLMGRTMTDSTVTFSDDPGCWHCDTVPGCDADGEDMPGHADDCDAYKALAAWRASSG